MLTPYDPNFQSNYADNNNMEVENRPAATTQTLKRTNSNELDPLLITSKKVKTEQHDKAAKEIASRKLKEYIEHIYPEALHDFNICVKQGNFNTAYHFAAHKIDPKLIELLNKCGAPVDGLDAENENALMVACRVCNEFHKVQELANKRKSEKCIELLLNAGCNPWQINTSGASPMSLIASSQSVTVFRQLKKLGYDLNAPLNCFNDTLPIYFCNGLKHPNKQDALQLITCLVDLECDLLKANQFGTSPLKILVDHKILNADGYLVLLRTIPQNQLPLARKILLSTDDINVYEGLFENYRADDIEEFSEDEINDIEDVTFNTFDSKGKSPLYRAVERLDTAMVEYLLRNGTDYQQQRPIDPIPTSEAPSPYEMVEIKIKEFYRLLKTTLIAIKEEPILLSKKTEKLSNLKKLCNECEDPEFLKKLNEVRNNPITVKQFSNEYKILEILEQLGKDRKIPITLKTLKYACKDLEKDIFEIKSSSNRLNDIFNAHMIAWEKLPSICDCFLLSNGNEDSKDQDYYNLILPHTLYGYELLLQTERNSNTSNKVLENLEAFPLVFKKILDKYQEENESLSNSEDEFNEEPKKLETMDFLFHFGKFFKAIQSTLAVKRDQVTTCEHLNYLIELMQTQFATGNFDEEIDFLEEDISCTQKLECARTPETEPLSDDLTELDNNIELNSAAETQKTFFLQDDNNEDVECEFI